MEKKTKTNNKFLEKRFSGNELKYFQEIVNFGFKFKRDSFIKMIQNKWSKKFKRKYSITTNSCTSSLHSAFMAINVQKNDEILVPSLTPFMCATTVHLAGAIPIYVDVDKNNFLIDINDLQKKITKNTKAVLAVHSYSGVCDLINLKKICEMNKLYLIEDCAQSFLSKDKNNILSGSIGDISCWSFQYSKQLTTGDGGILATDNPILAKKLREITNLGYASLRATNSQTIIPKNIRQNPSFYRTSSIGFNYRMSEFTAAIALAQLENSNQILKMRKKCGVKFYKLLQMRSRDVVIQDINIGNSTFFTVAFYIKKNISWEKFRKKFIEFGGEGFYSAAKPVNQEIAIKRNSIGRCFSNCKKDCVKSCIGTPNAKLLQKKMILLQTNYQSEKILDKQLTALEKSFDYFNLK
jgi:perosamine synthetase